MRLAEWNRAGKKRRDMSGIGSTAGTDRIATVEVLNSTKMPSEQKNNLRERVCVCVWTQKRQFDCHLADTPMCLFCVEEW